MAKWTDDKLVLISEKEYEKLNNLQSKIDKAIEVLNKRYEEDKEIFKDDYDFKFILDFEEELLDILKESETNEQ